MSSKYVKGKISVIIPCYNQGKFINDAVDSVLKQTYQDFEIIIINDCSTDKYTNRILKNYKKPKTKVYHNTKNRGLASTRNYGYSLSNGEFIQFLDADDFLHTEKFEEQIKILSSNLKVDVSYTNCKYYYDNEKEYSDSILNNSFTENLFEDFVYKWQRGVSIPIHCALFRRRIWGKRKPFIEGFGAVEDWLMWIDISKNGGKLEFLDGDYAFYRIQENNMSKDFSTMIYWVSRAISYIADNYVKRDDLKIFNLAQEKYLNMLIDLFFIQKAKEEYEIKLNKYLREIELKENEIKGLRNNLMDAKIKVNVIMNSKTYKIGCLVTYFPKQIRNLLK